MTSSEADAGTGRVRETYVAALQHDLVGFDESARLVGVVRRPTGWFRSAVDENRPELGPPEDLLDEVKERHEDLKMQGMCDEGAHNAAWEDCSFADRYRAFLAESSDARTTIDELAEAVADGTTVVLVCFEGENKRCHRHLLVEKITDRVDG